MNTAARAFTPDPEGDIICHCAAVSQDDLTLAYRRLAQGDRTLGALCRSTGAGLTCGGCVARIGDILGRDTMVAARLTAKEALDDTHFALTFTPHFARHRNDGGVAQDALFAFRMGAQVHRRTFTLVDQDPVTGSVQIVIKREPNGLVSRWLADAARIGTAVEVSTPFGGLRDAGTSQPVFLAAGIGITPALSVIQAKQAGQARILWWVRSAQAPGLMAHVRAQAAHAGVNLRVFDTSSSAPRADADLLRASLSPGQDRPHICGPQGFVDKVMNSLDDLRWPTGDRHVASFVYTPGQGAKARTEPRHREISFEPLRDAIRTPSFHLRPAEGIAARMREARAFLHQFYHEIGADEPMQARLDHIAGELRRTGTYHQTEAELGFGARLAWR
ncbi:MAG: nitric oxide synthase oxygenase, partial [Pseudomonadota bacterium]